MHDIYSNTDPEESIFLSLKVMKAQILIYTNLHLVKIKIFCNIKKCYLFRLLLFDYLIMLPIINNI